MRHVTLVPVVAGLLFVIPIVDAQDSTPSAEHKVLAMEVGVWDAEISITIPGQDPKDAAKTKGVETNRMLADKWLISEFKGEFFGTPFEGHGVNGYDAKKGKYVATWVDSMSQQIDLMAGTYDEKTKTLTLNADSVDPASGKPMKMRLETQFKDADTRTFAQYLQVEGQTKFTKFMDIIYTKRKK